MICFENLSEKIKMHKFEGLYRPSHNLYVWPVIIYML